VIGAIAREVADYNTKNPSAIKNAIERIGNNLFNYYSGDFAQQLAEKIAAQIIEALSNIKWREIPETTIWQPEHVYQYLMSTIFKPNQTIIDRVIKRAENAIGWDNINAYRYDPQQRLIAYSFDRILNILEEQIKSVPQPMPPIAAPVAKIANQPPIAAPTTAAAASVAKKLNLGILTGKGFPPRLKAGYKRPPQKATKPMPQNPTKTETKPMPQMNFFSGTGDSEDNDTPSAQDMLSMSNIASPVAKK
jgi:hypothetical protein